MVGMVVTISPSFSLYRIVVFPAASSPTEKYYPRHFGGVMWQQSGIGGKGASPISILICFLPNRRPKTLDRVNPILTGPHSETELLQSPNEGSV
jgi:hypothetical protein